MACMARTLPRMLPTVLLMLLLLPLLQPPGCAAAGGDSLPSHATAAKILGAYYDKHAPGSKPGKAIRALVRPPLLLHQGDWPGRLARLALPRSPRPRSLPPLSAW